MRGCDWPWNDPLQRVQVDVWADSSRHRNDFGEFFLGHHIVEGFSWSSVEALLDHCEVSRCVLGEVPVPLGKYWRSSPLVFSLLPRCQGEWGSQK